jgi:hypothetical protein
MGRSPEWPPSAIAERVLLPWIAKVTTLRD